MDCFLCQDNEHLLIKEYEHWSVLIHTNQYYLGRCSVALEKHITDAADTSIAEEMEFWRIRRKLRDALQRTFHPDRINYSSLGNIVEHVHYHIIPRYKGKREFMGIEFQDEQWETNPSPYNRKFYVPEEVRNGIRDLIKDNL